MKSATLRLHFVFRLRPRPLTPTTPRLGFDEVQDLNELILAIEVPGRDEVHAPP